MKYGTPFLAITFAALSLNAQTPSAVFEFTSTDPAGEGFNDDTPSSELPATVVGNNPGETLGEMRQIVLEAAGARWSNILLSNVPIEVDVDYQDFGGFSGGTITLAGANNTTVAQNFTNAPLADTLYPIALANSLAGRDLSARSDIEITANSNETLNDPQSSTFWYYGLDGEGGFNSVDFLNVISHELGHGLGFIDNVSSTSGIFIGGRPNVFTANVFDTSLELSWLQMSNAQRAASTRSDPNLVWDGPNVTGAIDGIENFVFSGSNTDDDNAFAAAIADFSGDIPNLGVTGQLVLVDDGVGVENNTGEGSTADLVEEILNTEQVSGNIALIARGIVNFDFKVLRAKEAGAIAAVIYNNRDGDELISPSGDAEEPAIPVVFISENSGNALLDLLSDEVVLSIFPDRVVVQTDDTSPTTTRLRLHAPATFEPGSSVSHWTEDTAPNLLMEPRISDGITADLDLTVLFMKDLGWQTQNIDIPYLTYDLWLIEVGLDQETTDIGQNDDFDDDGLSNIEEYYHGTDPRSVDQPQLEIAIEDSALRHQRSTLSNDIILEYQRGQTLQDFATFDPPETTTPLPEQLETAEIGIDSSRARRFFRIRLQTLEANEGE